MREQCDICGQPPFTTTQTGMTLCEECDAARVEVPCSECGQVQSIAKTFQGNRGLVCSDCEAKSLASELDAQTIEAVNSYLNQGEIIKVVRELVQRAHIGIKEAVAVAQFMQKGL